MDWASIGLAVGIGALLVLVVSPAVHDIWRRRYYDCVRSHREHRDMWIQYIPTGDHGEQMIMIIHPEEDVTVCDEWKRKER